MVYEDEWPFDVNRYYHLPVIFPHLRPTDSQDVCYLLSCQGESVRAETPASVLLADFQKSEVALIPPIAVEMFCMQRVPLLSSELGKLYRRG